jgi:plastocyanin
MASKCAYRPAKGIARFPDGGTPDYLLEKTTLYIYDRQKHEVKKLVDFDDLSELLGCHRSSWESKLTYTDSLVCYRVSPVMEWQWYMKEAETQQDSQRVSILREKYSRPFVFNPKTMKIAHTDSSSFVSAHQKAHEVDFTEFNHRLKEAPLSELGLVVQDLYPKSDEDYIQETIFLKNTSSLTRQAVIEQIISKLSKQKIKGLLRAMEAYKNNLEGLEKTEYEIHSEDVYKEIKALL